MNARSTRPVAVVDRTRNPITEPSDLYGGSKGKINVTFYPYSTNGNHGIGVALNGVQKISEGEAFGASAPAVESMFDMLDDDDLDTDDLDVTEDEVEETPAPAKKAPAKKAAAKRPAKKAAAKPEPEPEDDEVDEDEEDLYDDLDDI
jgi:cell division septation protein DedD